MGTSDKLLAKVQAAVDEMFEGARAVIFVDGGRITTWCAYVPGEPIACPLDAVRAYVVVRSKDGQAEVWIKYDNVRAGTSLPIPKAVVSR